MYFVYHEATGLYTTVAIGIITHGESGHARTSRVESATAEMARDGGQRRHTCEGVEAQVPKENRTGPVRRRRGGGGARPTTGPRASGVREHDGTPVRVRLTPTCIGSAGENPAPAGRGSRTSAGPLRGAGELRRPADAGNTRWESGQSQAGRQLVVEPTESRHRPRGPGTTSPVRCAPASRWDTFIPLSFTRNRAVSRSATRPGRRARHARRPRR